ncbi:peptidoglycan DD-metalloendopeptidase family protein [Patescibacteria group bacterium]
MAQNKKEALHQILLADSVRRPSLGNLQEAYGLFLYCQTGKNRFYPQYLLFSKELDEKGIAVSFNSPEFRKKLQDFYENIVVQLKEEDLEALRAFFQTEGVIVDEAEGVERNTIDPDTLKALVEKLDENNQEEIKEATQKAKELIKQYEAQLENSYKIKLNEKEVERLEALAVKELVPILASSPDDQHLLERVPGALTSILERALEKPISTEQYNFSLASSKSLGFERGAIKLSSRRKTEALVKGRSVVGAVESIKEPAEKKRFLDAMDVLINEKPNDKPEEIVQAAGDVLETARLASVPKSVVNKTVSSGTDRFFSSFAKTPTQTQAATAADLLLATLPAKNQEYVKQKIVEKTWSKLLQNPEKLVNGLGESFVQSNLYNQLNNQVQRSGLIKPSSSGVGGLFENAVGGLLINQGATGLPEEAVIRQIQALYINSLLSKDKRFLNFSGLSASLIKLGEGGPEKEAYTISFIEKLYVYLINDTQGTYLLSIASNPKIRHRPNLDFSLDLLDFLSRWIKKAPKKAAATGAAKKTAKGAATAAGVGVAKKGFGAGIRSFLGSIFSKLGLKTIGAAIGGVLTGGWGVILPFVIAPAWNLLKKLGSKIFGFFSFTEGPLSKGAKGILDGFQGIGVSNKQKKNNTKVWAAVALFVCLPILLVMGLTSSHVLPVRDTALVSPPLGGGWEYISEGGVSSFGPGPFFTYNGNLPPPAGLIASSIVAYCPVTGGAISQGPHEPGASHENLNAYDFSVNQGAEVRAAHDAYVVNTRNDFENDQYQYRSYGNFVLLVGQTPPEPGQTVGEKFFTIYAHLEKDSVPEEIKNAASGEVLIEAGTLIGRVDNNGYSTGNHLHFGFEGPGEYFSLPPGCP